MTDRRTTGRARTVLISHAAAQPVASITTIVARRLRRRGGPRLVATGSMRLAPATHQHLEEVVLATVDRITDGLGVPRRAYELSIVTLAAASTHDLNVEIGGHSLDTAASLAILSAALQLPIRPDLVSTGEVSSSDGDIRPVGGLPQKLQAACTTPGVEVFAYPDLDPDHSLAGLAPEAFRQAAEAVATASGHIRVIAVRDLGDLIHRATTMLGRVQAALSAGYFHRRPATVTSGAKTLLADLDTDFWRCLEASLYQGRVAQARRLLSLRARAELRRHEYPSGLGAHLLSLVRSVPPAVRRRRRFLPLLPAATCFQLGCLAGTADQQDATELLCAASGQLGDVSRSEGSAKRTPKTAPTMDALLESTLEAISAERLTEDVGVPADEARATFVLPGAIIDEYDQFNDTITAFHRALLRHTDGADAPAQPDDALSLLERAYADAGGLAAARAEGKFASGGGMRVVLDRMTDQHKHELRFKRVHRILAEALDPQDWEGQVRFMRALVQRLHSHLPAAFQQADPSRLVRRRDEIVRTYVQGIDRLCNVFRTL